MTIFEIAHQLGDAQPIPDESVKHVYPVAFRLGEEAAARGPNSGATVFPDGFASWSRDRQLAFHAGYQTRMKQEAHRWIFRGGRA